MLRSATMAQLRFVGRVGGVAVGGRRWIEYAASTVGEAVVRAARWLRSRFRPQTHEKWHGWKPQ